jgi:hypothetical protein
MLLGTRNIGFKVFIRPDMFDGALRPGGRLHLLPNRVRDFCHLPAGAHLASLFRS